MGESRPATSRTPAVRKYSSKNSAVSPRYLASGKGFAMAFDEERR